MAEQVEARSLSSLNFLAANPPQYPINPTEEPRESLVLYISRVPGTRDVILSTFKPQLKNVTGEDVANSLYYVHLDDPADALMATPQPPAHRSHLEAAERDLASPRSSGESARAPIHRKPVPVSPGAPKLETHVSNPVVPGAEVKPPPITKPPSYASDGTTLRVNEMRQPPPRSNYGPGPGSGPLSPGYQPNPMFQNKRRSDPPPELRSPRHDAPPRPPPKDQPTALSPIARKPLGPRPEAYNTRDGASLAMPTAPNSQTWMDVPRSLASPLSPSSRPPPYEQVITPTDVLSPARSPLLLHTPSRSPSPTKRHGGQRPSFSPFSLTLIRRDPATGNQWNIGKVSSFQTNIPLPELADPNMDPDNMPPASGPHGKQPTIEIHLETSGYAKFRGMPTRQSVESGAGALRASLEASRAGSESPQEQSARDPRMRPRMDEPAPRPAGPAPLLQKVPQTEEGFSRQVAMAYTKSWTSGFRQAFRRRGHGHERSQSNVSAADSFDLASPVFAPDDLAPPRPQRGRDDSFSSVASGHSAPGAEDRAGHADRDRLDSPSALVTHPGPGLKPRGYMFLSPWDGLCEFRTGNGGRSLKCRHLLDAYPSGLGQLQKAIAQGDGKVAKAAVTGSGARPVSELRFNLPSADLFHSSKKNHGDGTKGLHEHFHRLWKNDGYSSDEGEDDSGPMDLSLGREKAGGGNRGKRAKLGKLIVHDEGLKMLDLVVAANMGVWWTAWEKSMWN